MQPLRVYFTEPINCRTLDSSPSATVPVYRYAFQPTEFRVIKQGDKEAQDDEALVTVHVGSSPVRIAIKVEAIKE